MSLRTQTAYLTCGRGRSDDPDDHNVSRHNDLHLGAPVVGVLLCPTPAPIQLEAYHVFRAGD